MRGIYPVLLRPSSAAIVATVILLAGLFAGLRIPIEYLPSIAPTALTVATVYPGADAKTVMQTVITPLEQNIRGVEDVAYFSSRTDNSGAASITLTLKDGANAEAAQIEVQNRLNQTYPRLPGVVQREGVLVSKSARNFALAIALYSRGTTCTADELSEIVTGQLADTISRINGVGELAYFGAPAAMRVWVQPGKLWKYKMSLGDIKAAILSQNASIPAGQLGGLPAPNGQQLNVPLLGRQELRSAAEFGDIVLRGDQNGGLVRLSDVARVELGSDDYSVSSFLDGHPASGLGIRLAQGANALATEAAIHVAVEKMAHSLPKDCEVAYPYDNAPFVQASLMRVLRTLLEATILVVLVMFAFIRDFRAVVIPAAAIPLVILGTIAGIALLGVSLNSLSLFAIVLSIGLIVDDAIIVVENVKRLMHKDRMTAYDATLLTLNQLTAPLIAIVVVLIAVFAPVCFIPGSVGVIYRQFAITVIVAMSVSAIVGLVVTPAMCVALLKEAPAGDKTVTRSRREGQMAAIYAAAVRSLGHSTRVTRALFLLISLAAVALLGVMPIGFLPDEDQGAIFTLVQLPSGSTIGRVEAAEKFVSSHFLQHAGGNVDHVFCVAGFGASGVAQNVGICFEHLIDAGRRSATTSSAFGLADSANYAAAGFLDGRLTSIVPPAVRELGDVRGFDVELVEESETDDGTPLAHASSFLSGLESSPALTGVRADILPEAPSLRLEIDDAKAAVFGVDANDVNDVLESAWGPLYLEDFIEGDRSAHVYLQGEASARSSPDDISQWFVRGHSGQMVPLSSIVSEHWIDAPSTLEHFNGLPAVEVTGEPSRGVSSGVALETVDHYTSLLPSGTKIELTGLSYQEHSAAKAAPVIVLCSLVAIFIALTILYDDPRLTVCALLLAPLGLIGSAASATIFGMPNDVFLQVALLVTMGLAVRSGVFILGFAKGSTDEVVTPLERGIAAANLRLRPVIMTSVTFVAGSLPLALAHGAGSVSQREVGIAVIGGTLTGTLLTLLFSPLLYAASRRSK